MGRYKERRAETGEMRRDWKKQVDTGRDEERMGETGRDLHLHLVI